MTKCNPSQSAFHIKIDRTSDCQVQALTRVHSSFYFTSLYMLTKAFQFFFIHLRFFFAFAFCILAFIFLHCTVFVCLSGEQSSSSQQ